MVSAIADFLIPGVFLFLPIKWAWANFVLTVPSFFFQNELRQRPGLDPGGRTQSSRALTGVGVPHVSRDPPTDSARMWDPTGDAGWILPRKEGFGLAPGTPPTRAREPPSLSRAHPGGGRREHSPSPALGGTAGDEDAAPPRFRGGVSARHTLSGPPPGPRLGASRRRRRPRLHDEGKRLRGDWTGSGDGGGGGCPGPSWLASASARASLSVVYSPEPRSRPGLGCKALPHWPFRDGRWLAHTERESPRSRGPRPCAPPVARSAGWGALPGLKLSGLRWAVCASPHPGARGGRTPGAPAARAPTPSASLQPQRHGCGPSSQFTDGEH